MRHTFGNALLSALYPSRCAFCGRFNRNGLCPDCEALLPRMSPPLREGPDYGLCAVPLEYRGIVREAMGRLKFGRAADTAQGFGLLLARTAAEELAGTFNRITWVPLTKRRRRKRGYDQAQLLALAAGRVLGMKPVRMLEKVRINTAQSGLDMSARTGNVQDTYRVRAMPAGAHILLIDDIITTGATLAECRCALLRAGAASVVCACAASSNRVLRAV